jgi:FkbM family methyltransferase
MLAIKLIQAFTSAVQVKGVPKIITKTKHLLFDGETEYSCYNGIKLRIDPTVNFHCLNVLHYSGYENVRTYEKYLRKGDVYVDVGGNLGYMSLNAEKLVGKEGKVIALEPDPKTLPLLRLNKQINQSDIVIVDKAASDESGTVQFHVATESGLSRLPNAHKNLAGMELAKYHDVQMDRLDNILDGLIGQRPVRFIKVDVEGHELRILRGAVNTLRNSKPILFLEINHGALIENNVTLKDIVAYLKDFGYEFFYVESHAADWFRLGRGPTYTLIDTPENPLDKYMDWPFDLLCVPKGA